MIELINPMTSVAIIRSRVRRPVCLALLSSLLLVAGCVSNGLNDDSSEARFPVVIGGTVPEGSGLRICSDYGSRIACNGRPYRLSYDGGLAPLDLRRHQGIDFQAPAGTSVISSTAGIISTVRPDHFCAGGSVIVETEIVTENPRRPGYTDTVYLLYGHIEPDARLVQGQAVHAGDILGVVMPATEDRACIGTVPHVHLTANLGRWAYGQHLDPNLFWKDGPGIVTCFDENNPPSPTEATAPFLCD